MAHRRPQPPTSLPRRRRSPCRRWRGAATAPAHPHRPTRETAVRQCAPALPTSRPQGPAPRARAAAACRPPGLLPDGLRRPRSKSAGPSAEARSQVPSSPARRRRRTARAPRRRWDSIPASSRSAPVRPRRQRAPAPLHPQSRRRGGWRRRRCRRAGRRRVRPRRPGAT